MSSAARFLLEFEATGDQEVVAKIRQVGAAGKETAADLQQLQGIQDPFEPVARGAESAVAPIQEVGTASAETTGLMTELGTEGTAAAEGITELGTKTEESAGKTMGFADAMGTMTGSIAAIGGSIGSLVGSFSRYNEIQLKVQKAQLTSARATEQSRKAEEGLDKVLSTATSNTANIAAAREKLAKAQGEMNKLMDQGVTSGAAFEEAQSNLQAAQKGLSAEFAKGGGDIKKLTDAMEKSELNSSKMAISLNNVEKALADQKQGVLDMVFGFSSMAGSLVQTIGSMGKWGKALSSVKGAMTALPFAATKGGVLGMAAAIAGPLVIAIGAAIQAFQVFRAVPKLFDIITAGIEQNVKKASESLLQLLEIGKQTASLQPLGGATIIPVYDAMIKKMKEMLKEKKIEVEANDVTIDSWDELKNTISKLPAEYQPIFDAIMGTADANTEWVATSDNAVIAANNMVNAAGTEEKAIASAGTATAQAATNFDTVAAASDNAAIAFAGVVNKVDGFNLRMGEESQTVEEAKGTLAGYNDVLGIVGPSLVGVTGSTDNAVIAFGKLANIQGETRTAVRNTAIAFNELVNHAHAGGEAIRVYSSEADAAVDPSASLDDEVRLLGEDLDESGAKAQETAHELLTLAGSAKNAQEAIDQNHLAFAQSVDALADMNAVMSNSTAHFEAVQTAVNDTTKALLDEQIKLEAAAQSAGSTEQAQLRLANAYKSGVVEIAEWRNGLEEAKAAQQGQIAQLASIGATFEELNRQSAGTLPPTIENLKLMGAAFGGSAQDAQAWLDTLSEAFATVQEAGNQMVNDLSDALVKGGDSLGDITDKWLEDMPEMFRERLDESQIVAMQGMADLQALAKANKFELEADFKTESLDKARSDFIGNLEQMRSEAKPKFKKIYDEAIKIAEKGTADQMHRVAEILASDDPWPVMLEKLKQIKLEQEGDRVGQDFIAGIKAAIRSGAPGVSALAQNLMTNVVPKGEKSLKPISKPVLDVDDTAAKSKIQAIANALDLLNSTTVIPKVDIDAAAAASKVQATANALNILNSTTVIPKIDVDATAAASKIQATVSALQILQNAQITITVQADTTRAVSALNAASNAALTMRNNFNAASSGVKSAVAAAGAAVTSFSSKASSSFAKAGTAGTQMANKVKSASSSMKSSLSSAASSAASFASKCVSSFNKVGSSATSNASKVRNLASAISRLKSKTITITTKYVTQGRPGGLQHGGAFIANNPTTIGGTKIGEHYKPELVTVTPLTNPNNLDRTVTVNTPASRGGGSREVVIPVTLMLDNKVLIRTVRRGLVEEVSGTM